MSRLLLSLGGAVVMLAALAGGAVAATSPQIVPEAASIGTRVTFLNGCVGVVDDPPAQVRVALVEGSEPPEASTARSIATLVDPWTYVFTVPDVQPGDYDVLLECAPGDWRTNLSEPGGAAAMSVHGECEGVCDVPEIAVTLVDGETFPAPGDKGDVSVRIRNRWHSHVDVLGVSIAPVEWPGPKSTSCFNLPSLAPGEEVDVRCTVRTDSEATCAPMVSVGVGVADGGMAAETWRNLPADIAGLEPCVGSPDPPRTDTAASAPMARTAGLAPLLLLGVGVAGLLVGFARARRA